MTTRDAILITGATGTIGRRVAAHLLRDTDADVYPLLHERGARQTPGEVLTRFFDLPATAEFVARLYPVAGDITRPCLGLASESLPLLHRRVNRVLHSAATTRFDLPLDAARSVNVCGTREVMGVAGRCERIEQVGFLSTAYVAGKRTGLIREPERAHDEGFANTYEQSKYEAEAVVAESGLPVAIYRLSTVLGDSRTGRVAHFTAPHQALRMMHAGLVSMLPGDPASPVDLISDDIAAEAVFELFTHHFNAGDVFHITAPEDKTFSLQESVETSHRELAGLDPGWARRGYPLAAIAPLDAFDLFLRSAQQANNPLMHGVMQALSQFARQLAYPKCFDRSTVLRYLPDYDRRTPDIRSYYGKVVKYCLDTGWGRHV